MTYKEKYKEIEVIGRGSFGKPNRAHLRLRDPRAQDLQAVDAGGLLHRQEDPHR